jgi:hypothetical protein
MKLLTFYQRLSILATCLVCGKASKAKRKTGMFWLMMADDNPGVEILGLHLRSGSLFLLV